MPIIEETDGDGFMRRRFKPNTTSERRRDRALRRYKIGVNPDLYAMVWESSRHISEPETVALLYQTALARLSLAGALRGDGAKLAGVRRQIARAMAALDQAATAGGIALPAASIPIMN